MLVTLGKAGIKTLDDLADLATDELVQKKRVEPRRRQETSNRPEDKGGVLAEYGLSDEQGNEIIMAARAHWFEDEPAPAEPAAETGGDANAEPYPWDAEEYRRHPHMLPPPHQRGGENGKGAGREN